MISQHGFGSGQGPSGNKPLPELVLNNIPLYSFRSHSLLETLVCQPHTDKVTGSKIGPDFLVHKYDFNDD